MSDNRTSTETTPSMESPTRGVSIICIEGGIGAGKSTALAKLKEERPDLVYVDEPVEQWEEAGLLEGMYSGKLNKAVFQHHALMGRAGLLLEAIRSGAQVIVTERSPWSDNFVFAEANIKNPLEKKAYDLTFKLLMRAFPKNTSLHIIYLMADVKVLAKRIERRGRDAEVEDNAVHTKYLKQLNELHDKLYTSALVMDDFSTANCIDTTDLSPFHVQQSLLEIVRSIIGDRWPPRKRSRPEDEESVASAAGSCES